MRRPARISKESIVPKKRGFAYKEWRLRRAIEEGTPSAAPTADEGDDERPSIHQADISPKVDWTTTIKAGRRTAANVVTHAPIFSPPAFPPSLRHLEPSLDSRQDFKTLKSRAIGAGALGLSSIRCAELAFAALKPVKEALEEAIKDTSLSEDRRKSLKNALKELSWAKHGIVDTADTATKVAAGQFNGCIHDLRDAIIASPELKPIVPTLKSCRPSVTHYFEDDERIAKANAASHLQPKASAPSSYRYGKSWDSRKPAYKPKSFPKGSWNDRKKPYKKPAPASSPNRQKQGNDKGRFHKRARSGQKK